MIIQQPTFMRAHAELVRCMRDALRVKTERWQGVAVNQDTRELPNVVVQVPLAYGGEDLDIWRESVRPNLPWADDAFDERVGGEPLNPGKAWRTWPWAGSAAAFVDQRFNHSYAERLWPKYARRTEDGRLHRGPRLRAYPDGDKRPRYGIGGHYGDLEDLVLLLSGEPHTRQAVVPLFFPEDTGYGDGGRKPCTLLYQFTVRGGKLNVFYPMRSCDLVRHFRDDCYLTVRLLLWVLEKCRMISTGDQAKFWASVVPGDYSMWITSLHVFESDWVKMYEADHGDK